MVSESEVKAKTDSQLLAIWANQNDYIAAMVTLVKTEIDRRNLDTSVIQVPTVDEIKKVSKASSNLRLARVLGFIQGAMGLIVAGTALLSSEVPSGVLSNTVLAEGLLLIVIAVGAWRGKQWAFTSGVIVYTLFTAFEIVNTIGKGLGMLRIVRPFFVRPGDSAATLLGDSAIIGVSLCLALMFNSLRKRGRKQQ